MLLKRGWDEVRRKMQMQRTEGTKTIIPAGSPMRVVMSGFGNVKKEGPWARVTALSLVVTTRTMMMDDDDDDDDI